MICPWCSGKGCGSCRGTGERADLEIVGYRCTECGWWTSDTDEPASAFCPDCCAEIEPRFAEEEEPDFEECDHADL